MSLDKWAILIAVLGLVLHIPLSMLAHWLSPKFQDAWARRSEQRVLERISHLADQKKHLQHPDIYIRANILFQKHIISTTYLVCIGLLCLVLNFLSPPGPEGSQIRTLGLVGSATFFFGATIESGYMMRKWKNSYPNDIQSRINAIDHSINTLADSLVNKSKK